MEIRHDARGCSPNSRWVAALAVASIALAGRTAAQEERAQLSEREREALRDEIEPLDSAVEQAVEDESVVAPQLDPGRVPISLPGGQQSSAVSAQAISLPNAEGSIEGMGESFSPVLSSGTATFSVPIAVAPGRAGVQPSLALTYSTTGGNGPVGFGWSLGAPFISRQTDRGLPRYVETLDGQWHAEEDRFIYNGGQELVPVDADEIGRIERAAAGITGNPAIPSDVAGWQQYRARVEGGFMRFFRSIDSTRWVVQSRDGTRFDFGVLPSGQGPSEAVSASARAVERDPERTTGGVYRWLLTRMSDSHGSTVYYLYDQHEGQSYLSDVYYVSPVSCAGAVATARTCAASLSEYGARVRLVYEARTDVFASYVSGWRIETGRRLKRIEVTAYDDGTGGRTLVRRYHLSYGASSYHSLLERVQVEGRPQTLDGGSQVGTCTYAESRLGDRIDGTLLPPMTFRYSAMPSSGTYVSAPVSGFGGISTRVMSVANSPPHSADEARSDLFDVNSDGLPDLIVTDPARYRTSGGAPAVGVFFNGFDGNHARPAGAAAHFSGAIAMPMDAGLSSVLNLGNANVVPMDIDGDGRSDLLHMPRARRYGWWAPTRGPDTAGAAEVSPYEQAWEWTYGEVELPQDDTDPRIDLGNDSEHIQILDVNNDHLIDVVRTTGTSMQTWVNLSNYPEGEGRFGSYRWTGSEWALSTQPITSCLLHAGVPLDFEDPEVRFADMNGDGILDIAKVRRGRVIYWPGRGEGSWGDGPRACESGFASDRHIEMSSPPAEINPELDGVFLSDVNMDGAADLVQVRFRELDVWFNRGGAGWTGRTIARSTPFAPAFAPRIRFADIDGSSTTDIVWANAGDWQFIDPTGGTRPRLLVAVDNGLGAETTISYGSSADDYLSDLVAAEECAATGCERFTWGEATTASARLGGYRSTGSPVISTVVRSVSTTDRFYSVGRMAQVSTSRFAYHDGYYEGIEQEFRGFGAADAITEGDAGNPTVLSRTHFLQGRRGGNIADDRLADNPDEALKGREVLTEVFDEAGVFLSTSFATITNRHMLTGLDGREIHYAFVSETNELRYDVYGFAASTSTVSLPAIRTESIDDGEIVAGTASTRAIQVRGTSAARIRTTFDEVDTLGQVRQQTAHGQVAVQTGGAIDGVIVSHSEPELVSQAEWIWRTRRTFVTGHGTSANLGDTTNSYNTSGDLVRAQTVITSENALPYYFHGEEAGYGGGAIYTQTDEDADSSTVYDAWGNALASCAGAGSFNPASPPTSCLRFGTVEYDSEYAQLAETERVRIGVNTYLTYEGEWDRGLGAIVSATDPNGLTTSVTYDGLGRLTSVRPPSGPGCSDPTTRIAYELTASPIMQPVSRVITTTELDCDGVLGEDALVSIAYVDGLGRARAVLATGDQDHAWVRSGITTLDSKGAVRNAYQPEFFDVAAPGFSAALALSIMPFTTTSYDAFGRVVQVLAEDGSPTETRYHALATEVWDALDLGSGPHASTPSIVINDGHGRAVDQVLYNNVPPATFRLWTYYRADGAVLALVRAQAETARPSSHTATLPDPHVLRTFTYDSVGRRLGSNDPDTDDPSNTFGDTRTWRYLFNRVGDLAAVRDPRGGGQNFFYDFGGRLVGEQYITLYEAQNSAAELPPDANTTGNLIGLDYSAALNRLDVVYHYDAYPAWVAEEGVALPSGADEVVLGRATGVNDRAQRSVLAYDERGNVVWTARQLALISDPLIFTTTNDLVTARPITTEQTPLALRQVAFDLLHTYVRTARFDHAGRPRSMVLPQDPDYDDVDEAPLVGGLIEYDRRGLPHAAAAFIGCDPESLDITSAEGECLAEGGSLQRIIASLRYERDGLVRELVYGDDADFRSPTVSQTQYDGRRRPTRMTTVREPTDGANVPDLGAVATVFDQQLSWDEVSNLVQQRDWRDDMEWPMGQRPQTVDIEHDSLYRVIDAEFAYGAALGTEDDGSDWRDSYAQVRPYDPMDPEPAASAAPIPEDRVVSMQWEWDYLANMTSWDDDSQSFHERSLGTIANGEPEAGPGYRPSALYFATNLPDHPSDLSDGHAGMVQVDYGRGGNVIAMTIRSQCQDRPGVAVCRDYPTFPLASRVSQVGNSCLCAHEVHYEYRYDELNRLVEARRFQRFGGEYNAWVPQARQRYRYDAANQRVIKQTLDQDAECAPPPPCPPTGCLPAPPSLPTSCERVALYVYPGDFERRGLETGAESYEGVEEIPAVIGEAPILAGSETQYVVAGARTVWRHGAEEIGYDRDHRFTVVIGDLIQTNAAVMDVRTGELLEASTYYPNGARETYRVNFEALTPAEIAGFTGKEADDEVGVVYFGERYLMPRLGRWATPDPLHIHAVGGGEALNSYHYVAGNLLTVRDPLGLTCEGACEPGQTGEFTGTLDGQGYSGEVGHDGTISFDGLVIAGPLGVAAPPASLPIDEAGPTSDPRITVDGRTPGADNLAESPGTGDGGTHNGVGTGSMNPLAQYLHLMSVLSGFRGMDAESGSLNPNATPTGMCSGEPWCVASAAYNLFGAILSTAAFAVDILQPVVEATAARVVQSVRSAIGGAVGRVGSGGMPVTTGLRAGGGSGYRGTFFTAHPDLEGDVIVHHAIEQQVLRRHPGLFTPEEIHALDNLRGIPNTLNGRMHLSHIRVRWNRFYDARPNPTRAEVIEFAAMIDEEWGDLFLPAR